MIVCANCQTQLEEFEISCHGCGQPTSSHYSPAIPEKKADPGQLESAFKDWCASGEKALKENDYERAIVDFKEALRRVKALDKPEDKEELLRLKLALAQEKCQKYLEALGQYFQIAEHATTKKIATVCEKKILKLKKAVETSETYLDEEEMFCPAEDAEMSFAPLYCPKCRRLLSEAEAWGARKSPTHTVRCLCAHEGKPLVKRDHAYRQTLLSKNTYQGARADLLEIGQGEIACGKKRKVAILLAFTLGNFGAHKFYLGETLSGWIFVFFSFTFLPWLVAIFDAASLWHTSDTTFNLTYNIEEMLKLLPESSAGNEDHSDVFSMEITYDPEDFLDELSV